MASKSSLSSPMGPLAREEDRKTIEFMEEMTRNADDVQKKVLHEILTQNARTEYLKGFNLDGATDRKTFKSKIPMISYEDIQPLIQRIADGDTSPILSAHPVFEFICSSGTSGGEPKLIPSTKEDTARNLLLRNIVNCVTQLHIEGLDKGKSLFFGFTRSDPKTKGGILMRHTSTSFYNSDLFKTRPYNPFNVGTSPIDAILCSDTFQSMYVQMLCGLYEREQVNRIGTVFAPGLLRVIAFLELNWQQLAHDIRTGSLNPKVTDESLRVCMTRVMRPDPDLADFLSRECAKGTKERTITRIWPNTKFLEAIVTGTMSEYIQTLDYYSGGLPKVSMLYGSSESYFGINLNPMCEPSEISYTLMPNMAYFEFLPHESDSSDELTHTELVNLVDVEIGKQYELVITTYSGLYRYRVYDILQVTGFYNSAPQFRFIRRKNVVLNIDWEKTTEVDLQGAVASVSEILQGFETSVVEYTSYANTTTIPGHYVIYYELVRKGSDKYLPSDEVLDRCCLAMEESLNSIYHLLRTGGSIGPLEIRVVKRGTFEELTEYALSRGASINQYKVPRCVSFKPIVELLDSRVVSKHFSLSSPKSDYSFDHKCRCIIPSWRCSRY